MNPNEYAVPVDRFEEETKARHPAPIRQRGNQLHEEADRLATMVDMLEQRIAIVLTPRNDPPGPIAKPEAVEVQSPMADELSGAVASLRTSIARLDNIVGRVEL